MDVADSRCFAVSRWANLAGTLDVPCRRMSQNVALEKKI